MGPKVTNANFAVYRIALKQPEGTLGYIVTHAHPELRIELVNRMDLAADLVVMEARVFGPGSADLAPLARGLPFVTKVEIHLETARSTLYRITFKPPLLWSVLRRHRILTRYPVVILDGWMRFETLASADQIRRLVADLQREVGPSRVEAVHQGSVRASALGLTPSQQFVFREALASGFFSSPRRISLTGLAKRLGRSKSTVSQQIALI
ncbi:MAG: helix-turn-helix domain-containing protein, partial [Thermoplasmata archaeon]